MYLCPHVQIPPLLCVFTCVFVHYYLCIQVYSTTDENFVNLLRCFTAAKVCILYIYFAVYLRANTHAERRTFCVFVCIHTLFLMVRERTSEQEDTCLSMQGRAKFDSE